MSVEHTPIPLWHDGWYRPAQAVPSPNHGPRPLGVGVDLVVIHSISLPPGVYGGGEIERFFTNHLDWNAHPYFGQIRGLQVSAHFLIRREGSLVQFVSVLDRAWHAGPSRWCGRDNCNDFSVGIELEGLEGTSFESSQYTTLVRLLQDLSARFGIERVAGHEHVAPGRKADPGAGFDWVVLQAALGWAAERFPDGVLRA